MKQVNRSLIKASKQFRLNWHGPSTVIFVYLKSLNVNHNEKDTNHFF
jgi:hypothetical protein